MGREKKHAGRVVGPGGHAKERHKKTLRSKTWGFPTLPPTVLNARPVVPNLKSKHHSYYELVENKDKKKKLEFKITNDRNPPPGFEFVPIGNPELTTACKEMSREQDAMIFIVSTDKFHVTDSLSHHVNRIGHHIRQTIVEQAREAIGDSDDSREGRVAPGLPEPIPETQEEINEQADKAIRDLFPRIPNTDRQLIIEHSFKKGASKKGEPLVGLARGITLSRRVQLAVLAHIRHTHTRYDQLLRETSYANARKAVESLCLDILVKWRGDEETGRDQLDEILREVIVISDTESEDEDAEEEDDREDGGSEDGENETSVGESGDSAEETTRRVMSYSPPPAVTPVPEPTVAPQPTPAVRYYLQPIQVSRHVARIEPAYTGSPYLDSANAPAYAVRVGKARRGFKRYQAALQTRWGEARDRVRLRQEQPSENSIASTESRPPAVARQESLYQGSLRPADPPLYREVPYYSESSRHPVALRRDAPPQRYEEQAFRRVSYADQARPVATTSSSSSSSRTVQPVYLAYEGPVGQVPPPVGGTLPAASTPQYRELHRGADHNAPSQRAIVRSEQAQDYLVPSVEPLSPTFGQLPSSVPVFVRTVSPRVTPRLRGYRPEGASIVYETRRSPDQNKDDYASTKRRRVFSDNAAVSHAAPRFESGHQYLERDSRRVFSTGEPMHATPSLPPAQDGWQQQQQQQTQQRPPPMPFPTDNPSHGETGMVLRGDSTRPIVVEDWPGRTSPVVPVPPARSRHGDFVPEHHSSRIAEIRREAQHRHDAGQRGSVPADSYPLSSRPEHDQVVYYRRQHDSGPPSLRRYDENYEPYDPHRPLFNDSSARPFNHQPPPPSYSSKSTPHFEHAHANSDHRPQFVRPVNSYDQSYASDGRLQPQKQYEANVGMNAEAPRRVDGIWEHHRTPDFLPRRGGPPVGVPISTHHTQPHVEPAYNNAPVYYDYSGHPNPR